LKFGDFPKHRIFKPKNLDYSLNYLISGTFEAIEENGRDDSFLYHRRDYGQLCNNACKMTFDAAKQDEQWIDLSPCSNFLV
jgi:hypothetical protein